MLMRILVQLQDSGEDGPSRNPVPKDLILSVLKTDKPDLQGHLGRRAAAQATAKTAWFVLKAGRTSCPPAFAAHSLDSRLSRTETELDRLGVKTAAGRSGPDGCGLR